MIQLAELQLMGTRGRFPTDLTDNGGTLTGSNFGGGGEGTAKIIDNLSSTKNYVYIGANFNQVWYRYESTVPAVLNWYTITSANDTQARDPKSWKLQGSNDGNNWTDLDTQSNVTFTARFQTKRFDISGNSTAYKYFRLYITERYANSDNGFQMAEWQLYGVEQIPSDEQATSIGQVGGAVSALSVYPNPTVGQLFVGGLTEPAAYVVYELGGREVSQGTVSPDEGLPTDGLACGVYLLRVDGQVFRFVKR